MAPYQAVNSDECDPMQCVPALACGFCKDRGVLSMFSGSIPPLVPPFRDGAFDERAFRGLVDWQIEQGSSALVPCGTTGEASTLSNAEHHRGIAVCVEAGAARV